MMKKTNSSRFQFLNCPLSGAIKSPVALGKLKLATPLLIYIYLGLSFPVLAQPLQQRVVLIGDSTMAPYNGYGQALCQRLERQAECWNLAKNGRSSKSFREEGLWTKVLEKLHASPPAVSTWVLIQFGHNDQPGKPGRSTDLLTEYPFNLATFVEEARAAGMKPILVTPLIRRSFKNGQHIDELAPWAQSMKTIAHKLQVPLIDLHATSRQKVRDAGEAQADHYAVSPPGTQGFDRTHLGPLGACVFSEQVLKGLSEITGTAYDDSTFCAAY